MKSIIDQGSTCIFCAAAGEEHHWIFGMSLREIAENQGIKSNVCRMHHTSGEITRCIHGNSMAERLSKMYGQACWERHYIAENHCSEQKAREKFMEIFGISFC
ncbi:MAG: hypothetical protein MJZ37_08010 [Bacilli bacterium]|nr:hypothetical protein [Bacilli bacterium]